MGPETVRTLAAPGPSAVLLALVLAALPAGVAGQEPEPAEEGPPPLATAQVPGYPGTWLLTLEMPDGPVSAELALEDVEGNLAGRLSTDGLVEPRPVRRLALEDARLVLEWRAHWVEPERRLELRLVREEDVLTGDLGVPGIVSKVRVRGQRTAAPGEVSTRSN